MIINPSSVNHTTKTEKPQINRNNIDFEAK